MNTEYEQLNQIIKKTLPSQNSSGTIWVNLSNENNFQTLANLAHESNYQEKILLLGIEHFSKNTHPSIQVEFLLVN